MSTEVTVRIIYRDENGIDKDSQNDCSLSEFAGFLPAIGDMILDPSGPSSDRHLPQNRVVWTVVDRIFNPNDLNTYVALIVKSRKASNDDAFAFGG